MRAKMTAADGEQKGETVCHTLIVNYQSNQAAPQAVVEAIHAAGGQACAIQADVLNEQQEGETFHLHVCSDLPVMVPLSTAEIRRLFFHLIGERPLAFAYRLACSCWRRAHQAVVRLCHYKRRYALAGYLQL